eukprot:m.13352 g.13352  ORF g.13352 m.13352 type:complete len:122 (+) comp4839_c0_seq1:205-570(+)
MDNAKRSEIEDELKWVEDNIPNAGDAGYIGGEQDIDADFNKAANAGRQRLLPNAAPGGQGGKSQNSSYTQLFVFFVAMVLILNLILWLSGTNEDQEVPNLDRGFMRYVPPNLQTDDDPDGV